jgi:hypothetical protein
MQFLSDEPPKKRRKVRDTSLEHGGGKDKDVDVAFGNWDVDPGMGMDIDMDMGPGGSIPHFLLQN